MKKAALIFKSLADETRLRILVLLSRGERCVCDIMAVLALPQSTASRHLAYLRNAGWVTGTRRGVWMYYRIAETTLPAGLAGALIAHLAGLAKGKEDLQNLDNYLIAKGDTACVSRK